VPDEITNMLSLKSARGMAGAIANDFAAKGTIIAQHKSTAGPSGTIFKKTNENPEDHGKTF